MTVQLTTIDTPASNDTRVQERITEAFIGVDLTLLGAVSADEYASLGLDLPVEYVSFPKLASCAGAACSGGLDFISLSKDFQTRSDRVSTMDAVRTMARILDAGEGGFSAEVPADRESFEEAVGLLKRQRDGWGCIEVSVRSDADVQRVAAAAAQARSNGIQVSVRVRAEDLADIDHVALAGWADSVRLITDDPHKAREARFALRSAAQRAKRELRVLVEVGIIISGSQQAANERALLVEAMQGSPVFAGRARVIGTVYDVADVVESWIGLGAADGVIFLPASLPTDLASVIRGVLPLLKARGTTMAA